MFGVPEPEYPCLPPWYLALRADWFLKNDAAARRAAENKPDWLKHARWSGLYHPLPYVPNAVDQMEIERQQRTPSGTRVDMSDLAR